MPEADVRTPDPDRPIRPIGISLLAALYLFSGASLLALSLGARGDLPQLPLPPLLVAGLAATVMASAVGAWFGLAWARVVLIVFHAGSFLFIAAFLLTGGGGGEVDRTGSLVKLAVHAALFLYWRGAGARAWCSRQAGRR